MAGVCKIEITETVPELKTLLNHQKTVSGFQKIQALYLFKIGQIQYTFTSSRNTESCIK